jgi:DNA-binding HxlR family transcriptional regulator
LVCSFLRGSRHFRATDLGLSLHQLMRGLKSWSEMHMDDVLANRATYDARTA